VLAQRDFRLLWIGQGTSLLGDQFALIGLSWLVLQLTHDPLALGVLLALVGIPRLVCMLLGGAIVDRFSPRKIMLIADMIRIGVYGLLAVFVATGMIRMWMLYAISLVSGTVSGFFIPASNAVVPRLVSRDHLQAGNSIVQGTAQLSQAVGPALAGAIIAWFAHTQNPAGAPSLTGIAIAFGFDTLTFIVSVVTLWLMAPQSTRLDAGQESVSKAIVSGIRYMWDDPFLRTIFVTITLVNFIFIGPLMVGVPVLATTRLVEGAAAYGIVMSAYALGNLGGILGAGSLLRMDGKRFHHITLGLFAGFGVCLAAFGWINSTWALAAMLLVLGIGNGYIAISMITMLQKRTPVGMMGRLMSMIMIANMGLAPVSQSLSGWLSRWSLTGLFEIAGGLMISLAVGMVFLKEFSAESLTRELASQPSND
jgi:MFS family permease